MLYKPLILILFSPFLASLSESVEKIEKGKADIPFSLKGFFRDLKRSVHINLRYFIFSIIFSLLALLLWIIPVAGGIFSSAVIFFIQAYYAGCGFSDPVLERKSYSVTERLNFVQEHKGLMLGLGSGFMILLFIPVIGWFVAPAVCTISSTRALLKINL